MKLPKQAAPVQRLTPATAQSSQKGVAPSTTAVQPSGRGDIYREHYFDDDED